MIRTILVDDELRGLNSLRKMLERDCPDVNIVAECQDVMTAAEKIATLNPQLIFLDIAMPGKNGFDLLKGLDNISFETIFITAHNEYSMQAFKYSAVDYLLKPVDEDFLIDAVKRAQKRINSKQANSNMETFLFNLQKIQTPNEMKLCVPSIKGFQVLKLSDVIYCEAESSYTIFHIVNNHQIVASKPIIEYELLLADSSFCRIHKSFLVNLIHVKEYIRGEGGSVLLTNNKEVEVSRRRKEVFIAKMKELFKY
jgi:two-component system LytT family response regulator